MPRTIFEVLVVVLVLIATAFGQAQQPATTVQASAIDGTTHTGIGNAQVLLLCLNVPKDVPIETCTNRKGTADANGRFSFEYIPPGKYGLVAIASGYLSGYPSLKMATVEVQSNEPVGSIEAQLYPEAEIVGVVTDQNRKPVSGGQVKALLRAAQSRGGAKEFATSPVSRDGEFRLTGLAAGEYYVSVDPADAPEESPKPKADAKIQYVMSHSGLVYYPGVLDLQSAASIELSPGEHHTGATIRMPDVARYRIAGKVSWMATKRPAERLSLQLVPSDSKNSVAKIAQFRRNIPFDFSNVEPGDYVLRLFGYTVPAGGSESTAHPGSARLFAQGMHLIAQDQIAIRSRDITDVVLEVSDAPVITGKLTRDGDQSQRPAPLPQVTLYPVPGDHSLGSSKDVKVNADGTFAATNCDPHATW